LFSSTSFLYIKSHPRFRDAWIVGMFMTFTPLEAYFVYASWTFCSFKYFWMFISLFIIQTTITRTKLQRTVYNVYINS
jgi:hypothetical protein